MDKLCWVWCRSKSQEGAAVYLGVYNNRHRAYIEVLLLLGAPCNIGSHHRNLEVPELVNRWREKHSVEIQFKRVSITVLLRRVQARPHPRQLAPDSSLPTAAQLPRVEQPPDLEETTTCGCGSSVDPQFQDGPGMAFPNVYAHRKVAETKAKPCDICFKLSCSVLITPDNKVRSCSLRILLPPRAPSSNGSQDWFYVCPAHLKDTHFCTPKIDQAAIEARKKRELDEEIARVKKEYEEKQKKKKEKAEKGDKKDEAEDKKDKDDKPSEDTPSEDKQKAQEKTGSVRRHLQTFGCLLPLAANNPCYRATMIPPLRQWRKRKSPVCLSSRGGKDPPPPTSTVPLADKAATHAAPSTSNG